MVGIKVHPAGLEINSSCRSKNTFLPT